jgi:cephalosporin hydroxylase
MEYYATEPVQITQYKEEFIDLLKLIKILQPQMTLELGTHYGGTLYQWAKYTQDTVVAFDDYHINYNMYGNWASEFKTNIVTILGKTQDEDKIKNARNWGPYDFLFIDADHSYESVKHDWETYSPMMNPTRNTLVAFHDILPYKNTEVDRLWKEIKDGYEHWEFIEDPTQAGCGIGVLLIEPR